MDNKSKTGIGDDSRINVNEAYELEYWSEKLSVTEDELKEAVGAVGTSVDAVTSYLQLNK